MAGRDEPAVAREQGEIVGKRRSQPIVQFTMAGQRGTRRSEVRHRWRRGGIQ